MVVKPAASLLSGGIEDCVFGLALAGISAGAFETLTLKQGLPALPPVSLRAYLRMTDLDACGPALIFVMTTALDLKSKHKDTEPGRAVNCEIGTTAISKVTGTEY